MSITISGVPEFLTREQYVGFFEALGLDPRNVVEARAAFDGIHALVFAVDQEGRRIIAEPGPASGYPDGDPLDVDPHAQARSQKHRIFIPVRDDDADERTTRITLVQD